MIGFRASSYELDNRAGPVSGTNFAFCSYGKFQPGYRDVKGAKGGLFNPKKMGTSSASMGHFDFYSSKQSNNWLIIFRTNLRRQWPLCFQEHVVRGRVKFSQRPCKAFVVEKDSSQLPVRVGVFIWERLPARLPISRLEKLRPR